MSLAFVPPQKGRPPPSPAQIQKMLDENSQLIQGIVDYQNKGKAAECLQYQQVLHRNLVYLASIADAGPGHLPPPPPIPVSSNPPQQGPSSESAPRISSPSTNQGMAGTPANQGVQGGMNQQANPVSQMNSVPSPRGNQPGVQPTTPSGNNNAGTTPATTSSSGMHPSYNQGGQSVQQPQQMQTMGPMSNLNQPQSSHPGGTSQQQQQQQQPPPQQQQQTPQQQQMPVSPQGGHQNMNTYSRSMTPQQYTTIQGGSQQYSQASYAAGQNQPPHPQYGNNSQPQNTFTSQNTTSVASNDVQQNYQAPSSQAQGYSSPATTQPQNTMQPQQAQPISTQQSTPQAQGYSNMTAQSSTYNQPPNTTSQTYTAQSAQSYAPQNQSYAPASNSQSQWYQGQNTQAYSNSAPQANYAAPAANQAYTAPMGHTMNYTSQSSQQPNYGSPPATTQAGFGSPTSSQSAYAHHSPSSTSQGSTPPPAPIQQNRFPANYGHSGYMHYRPASQPPSQQHSTMASTMGPPSSNMHRQVGPAGNTQGQNYTYEQSQNYSYQSQ